MIEDMQHDLDEYEKKSKEAQEILVIKEKELNCLERLRETITRVWLAKFWIMLRWKTK